MDMSESSSKVMGEMCPSKRWGLFVNPVAADDPHRTGSQLPAGLPHRMLRLQITSPARRTTSAAVVNPPGHVHERDDLTGFPLDGFPIPLPPKKEQKAREKLSAQNLVHQTITPTFLAFLCFYSKNIYISTNSRTT